MTRIIKDINKFKKFRKSSFFKNKTIGLVPTMGALHEGHLELIKKSLSENDITVVSIFLNPTQFNNKNDFVNYPKTFTEDVAKLRKLKVDILFNPDYEQMYPDDYKYRITETSLSKILCGKYRPGHFDGVLTIVMKIFNIVKADRAYFGEKDYQQLKLVEGMNRAFFIDTKIIPVPIVRDSNGLALSSRNMRLSRDQIETAAEFHKILSSGISISRMKRLLKQKGFTVEYIEKYDDRILGAVYLGEVRLIDNVKI